MRAFKCDRCGKYFDKFDGNLNWIDFTIEDSTNLTRRDLCLECYDKLLIFMGEKEESSNSIFNERGKEMLKKISADKEPLTEGYLGKV